MKDLTLSTLLAVFGEIFGPGLFWALVALAMVVLVGFLNVLFRERTIVSGRFLRSEVVGLFGGFAAIWFVHFMTHSGYSDIGGPVDLIVIALIWIAGAIGTVMVAYTIQGLLFGKKAR